MNTLPYTTFEDILSLLAIPCDEADAVTNPAAMAPIMSANLIVNIPNHAAINATTDGNTLLRAWANYFGAFTLVGLAPHLITTTSTVRGDSKTQVTPSVKTMLDNLENQAKIYAAAANEYYKAHVVPPIAMSIQPMFGAAKPAYDPVTGLLT